MKKTLPYILELSAIAGVTIAGWQVFQPLGILLGSIGTYYYAQGIK